MILSFFIIFAVLIFSGYGINIFLLKYLLIAFLNEYIFVLGISLITSSVTVYFRDMEHILNIFVMAWQYLTPIMYSDDMIPDEYILDYSLSQEEQKKQWEKYCYDRRKAWQALSDDDKELSDSKNS